MFACQKLRLNFLINIISKRTITDKLHHINYTITHIFSCIIKLHIFYSILSSRRHPSIFVYIYFFKCITPLTLRRRQSGISFHNPLQLIGMFVRVFVGDGLRIGKNRIYMLQNSMCSRPTNSIKSTFSDTVCVFYIYMFQDPWSSLEGCCCCKWMCE